MASFQRLFPWFVLGRRIFIGVSAAYVVTSLVFGGTPAATSIFYAVSTAVVCLLFVFRSLNAPGWCRVAEMIGWNLVLAVVLTECALRVYATRRGNNPLLNDTLDAYRLTPGRDYGGGLRGNALGYPGGSFVPEKPTTVTRIAALGDSFAVGPVVPFADNYLTLLQTRMPGVEVYNFGVSAAGPREYAAILRRDVWQFNPNIVLVSIFVGNDITETLATPRHLDPRRHALYLCLTRGWLLIRECSRREEQHDFDRLRVPAMSAEAFREVEARRLAVCRVPAPPGLEKKWRRALAHLDEIIAECANRRVPVAFVLIPDEFQVNPDVLNRALEDAGLSQADIDLDAPQHRLLDWCAQRKVPCMDLLPYFCDTKTYVPLDTHWNVSGNHRAAEFIADWLSRHVMSRTDVLPPTRVP